MHPSSHQQYLHWHHTDLSSLYNISQCLGGKFSFLTIFFKVLLSFLYIHLFSSQINQLIIQFFNPMETLTKVALNCILVTLSILNFLCPRIPPVRICQTKIPKNIIKGKSVCKDFPHSISYHEEQVETTILSR